MKIYLSFLLMIVFIACGSEGGVIPADRLEIIYTKGDSFTAKKGDSIVLKTSDTQISIIRNMSNNESSITVISGSVSFLNAE